MSKDIFNIPLDDVNQALGDNLPLLVDLVEQVHKSIMNSQNADIVTDEDSLRYANKRLSYDAYLATIMNINMAMMQVIAESAKQDNYPVTLDRDITREIFEQWTQNNWGQDND